MDRRTSGRRVSAADDARRREMNDGHRTLREMSCSVDLPELGEAGSCFASFPSSTSRCCATFSGSRFGFGVVTVATS